MFFAPVNTSKSKAWFCTRRKTKSFTANYEGSLRNGRDHGRMSLFKNGKWWIAAVAIVALALAGAAFAVGNATQPSGRGAATPKGAAPCVRGGDGHHGREHDHGDDGRGDDDGPAQPAPKRTVPPTHI
jgi:hypothetical protein